MKRYVVAVRKEPFDFMEATTSTMNTRSTTPTAAGASPHGSGVRLRVLVIDDELRIRESIRRVLYRTCDVVLASSVAEALSIIEAGPRFDVILVDLRMPAVGGRMFVDMLEERTTDLPRRVGFVTGGGTPEMEAFLEASRYPVLRKPFTGEQLRNYVQALADVADIIDASESSASVL
jgi:CheY-like chemotaxis protein